MESDKHTFEVGILKDDGEAQLDRCSFSVAPGLSVLRNPVSIEQNDPFPV